MQCAVLHVLAFISLSSPVRSMANDRERSRSRSGKVWWVAVTMVPEDEPIKVFADDFEDEADVYDFLKEAQKHVPDVSVAKMKLFSSKFASDGHEAHFRNNMKLTEIPKMAGSYTVPLFIKYIREQVTEQAPRQIPSSCFPSLVLGFPSLLIPTT